MFAHRVERDKHQARPALGCVIAADWPCGIEQGSKTMRDVIQLVSTSGTGYAEVTTMNERTMTRKLEVEKYGADEGR